ncbi:MAG: carbohydrate kinase family protein [Mangrovibacterium sp.]
MTKKITVSGVGCCLVDRLYNHISFGSDSFSNWLSKRRGDGGLTPGHLVFKEEFEKFSNRDFQLTLKEITKGEPPEKINIGGPCIVALIHAAQMAGSADIIYRFYGCGGKDEDGEFLLEALKRTPVKIDHYSLSGQLTPSTVVLSDPAYDHGHGERIFINSIGAAWDYSPDKLDDDFFASDVVVFGGTALVPGIHDHLDELLEKAKKKGCITVVNTVFDFRSEKANPGGKWPLGKTDSSYRNTDLLITDHEEALHLSGKPTIDEALKFFREQGTGAVIVTNGSKHIRMFSSGTLFNPVPDTEMPVCEAVSAELKKGHKGDTTGCGDNFAGGVIASLVSQLQKGSAAFDLAEACIWGIVSGGYTCFYMGGTWFEQFPGEKLGLITPYYEQYKKQTGLCSEKR